MSLVVYYFLTKDVALDPDGTRSGFNFFPFGNSGGSGENENGGNQNGEEGNGENIVVPPPQALNFTQRLRKISVEPVSGAGVFDGRVGTTIRFIEKATGHIYEVDTFSPKVARISNTTIPLSYDALWGSKSDWFMARYLEEDNQTINTYSLNIRSTSTSTVNTTTGKIFPEDISDISVVDDSVFYLVQDLNSSSGVVSNFDGTGRKQIWSSEIKELNSQFVNPRTVALTTKPHHKIPGYMYLIDTQNGSIKKVLGNIEGLSGLVNSDATRVAYIEQGIDFAMKIYSIPNNTSSFISPITIPEKCVWSKKNRVRMYCATPKGFINPDSQISWYKGLVSFNDEIWEYDTATNVSNLIQDLSTESGEKIDVIKPILSENEQYLVFINKIDNSLWSLDLTKISTTTRATTF